MDKYAELKQEYDSLYDFLIDALPGDETCGKLLLYCVSAALKIWGSNVLYSPDYREAVNALTGSNYSIEQIVTAMSCCGDAERRLAEPEFFSKLIERDKRKGTRKTLDFILKLSDFLVGMAMVNGDFTVEEATTLAETLKGPTNHAVEAGITSDDGIEYKPKVTPKKEDSYLQNDALMEAARKQNTVREEKKKADKPDESSGNTIILVNINGNGLEAGALSSDKLIQSEKPEEAPTVTKPNENTEETLESLLAELDGLVGLDGVKRDVHSLMNFIKVAKIREARGMCVPTISYHLVFTGNPGTGKTTIARLVGKLYYHMGILPQGQLVETDRSALVAGYLGQTAIKTQKVIQQAMGGVLFIDEAYSLAGETDDSYGKEAIETILKAMEDHRGELVVIVAGYTELMHKFIDSNPGLSSRFSKYFEFPDYNGDELIAIFERFCKKNGYSLAGDAKDVLKEHFDLLFACRDSHFGNARTARNIFEKSINAQANRLATLDNISDSDLEMITVKDIAEAIGGAV